MRQQPIELYDTHKSRSSCRKSGHTETLRNYLATTVTGSLEVRRMIYITSACMLI